MKLALSIQVAIAIVASGTAWAQEPSAPEPSPDVLERALRGRDPKVGAGAASRPGLPAIDTSCPGASKFGGTDVEQAAFCYMRGEKFRSMRTLANEALRASDDSFRAHFLMGVALHQGEANLPKALFHLARSEELFIDRFGAKGRGASDEDINAYRRALLELVYVHGEMDHHEKKIAYVDALQVRLGIDYGPLKAWPLLKLKRFEEARDVARLALETGEPRTFWEPIALTALCAVESELRHRQLAYEACKAAAAPVRNVRSEGGVALSNAGAAAMEVFRFAEAERLYNEATRRPIEGTINPWGRLAQLYLRQARFAEAVTAVKRMKAYRDARPIYFAQQDEADARMTVASLLMVAGQMEDVLKTTSGIVDQPDRQGTSSASSDQNEAGNLLMDRVARLDVARRLEEAAAWSSVWTSLGLRARALKLRFEAWVNTRRAATILGKPERLSASLRPECPGSVELPAWLDAEVVSTVGSGVALAAIAAARQDETLPEDQAGPVFAALEAEAYHLEGDHRRALAKAEEAIAGLPAIDVLVRARSSAIAGASARALEQDEDAVTHFVEVLAADPGLIRRLGMTLPVRVLAAADDPVTRAAVKYLQGSSLYDAGGEGFVLQVTPERVQLSLADGSILLSASVPAATEDDDDDVDDVTAAARRVAAAAHERLLVPNVDVTQVDVNSLDGGLLDDGRLDDRARSILERATDGE